MVIGWILRDKKIPRGVLSNTISGVIMVMMLLIGVEMGGSEGLLNSFGSIITDAVLLTSGALVGTITLAWMANRFILKTKTKPRARTTKGGNHLFSFLIVAVFGAGVALGYCDLIPFLSSKASMWALYTLMALVGFSIGSDVAAIKALKSQPLHVIYLPVATILGTLLGILLLSPLIGLNIFDCMAIGSGFGYYSLSSVLLSEVRGVEIGAIALLVNVLRELTTVILAPVLARRFSPLSVICCGGATTLDITLPVIINTCGTSFTGMAIFQGVVVDLSVPFLVTFFASFA